MMMSHYTTWLGSSQALPVIRTILFTQNLCCIGGGEPRGGGGSAVYRNLIIIFM